jgi:CRP/FNR family transcriptional regulator
MLKSTCKSLEIEKCLARRVLCICNIILNHPLFSNIAREETHKLSAIADVIKLQAEETLFSEDSKIEQIYFVLEGRVKVYSTDLDSTKSYIHQLALPGDVIALETLYSDYMSYSYSAECLDDSTILSLDREKFAKVIKSNHHILFNLSQYLCNEVSSLKQRAEDLALKEVSERLWLFLQEAAEVQSSKCFELSISKTDLASLLGTILATLSRAFKDLESRKLIKVNRTHIELL